MMWLQLGLGSIMLFGFGAMVLEHWQRQRAEPGTPALFHGLGVSEKAIIFVHLAVVASGVIGVILIVLT